MESSGKLLVLQLQILARYVIDDRPLARLWRELPAALDMRRRRASKETSRVANTIALDSTCFAVRSSARATAGSSGRNIPITTSSSEAAGVTFPASTRGSGAFRFR